MTKGRQLGAVEQLFHDLHKSGALIPVQVLHIRGVLPTERVRAALDWLQLRHPMLRAHIRYGRLVFRPEPPFVYRLPLFEIEGTRVIPLRIVDAPWEDEMASELRLPLPRDNSPRLRTTLIRDRSDPELSHLILCADHATIDAHSINLLSRQLLEFLAGRKDQSLLVTTDLPPPLETRLPTKSDSGKPYQGAIRLPNRRVSGPEVTRVIARRLDAPTTVNLKSMAKAKGASLHGVIAAAFLLAIGESYALDKLTCLSTLDLRRMCRPPLPAETFGCYVDILRTGHALTGGLWPVARDVAFRLVSAIAKDQTVSSILKVPSWSRYRTETWATLSHRHRIDCLTITTAGESGLRQTYGDLQLDDVTMAVSLDYFGPSMMVIASERGGALDLCVNFSTRIMPPDDVRAITDVAILTLTTAGSVVPLA